jgi:hypothetical protein
MNRKPLPGKGQRGGMRDREVVLNAMMDYF